MNTTVLNTKISKVDYKLPYHAKYTTIQEFNKLTGDTFAARSLQANLVRKTDFNKKLTRFNRKITSNKAKYLEVLKQL